ncbi:Hypothetical predicted protein [Cloeon dipterum]|uniref:Poly [ADP-ribose] polymerase n=1 Tax=Cloeon dipterum TaxID=197152 RepID=A0A8S1CYV8_9INSE|nr:Hypothetical predicted protein [Cloeon dipterum]
MLSSRKITFLQAYPTRSIPLAQLQSYLPYTWLSAVDETDLQKGTYTVITLDEDSPEYKEIKEQVLLNNSHFKKICRIDQVENPYLFLMYLLKRHENYLEFFCKEERCFHGTATTNVDSIMNNNLNWRFFGRRVGHIHGKGVYFSKKAAFASQYAKYCNNIGCLLVAKVLVASVAQGDSQTILPAQNYDTTGSGDDILVKYGDNEFYPEFVVYF